MRPKLAALIDDMQLSSVCASYVNDFGIHEIRNNTSSIVLSFFSDESALLLSKERPVVFRQEPQNSNTIHRTPTHSLFTRTRTELGHGHCTEFESFLKVVVFFSVVFVHTRCRRLFVTTQKFRMTPTFLKKWCETGNCAGLGLSILLSVGDRQHTNIFWHWRLIEQALVCGSFSLVLKLTNNNMEIAKNSKRILYHTVSRRDQRNGVWIILFEFLVQYRKFKEATSDFWRRVFFGDLLLHLLCELLFQFLYQDGTCTTVLPWFPLTPSTGQYPTHTCWLCCRGIEETDPLPDESSSVTASGDGVRSLCGSRYILHYPSLLLPSLH